MIVNQEDGSVSLLSVLVGVQAPLPFPADQIPQNTAIPVRWYVLTLWKHDEEDLGTTFFQRFTLNSPSGKLILAKEMSFGLSESPLQVSVVRGTLQFHAFPVNEIGTFVAKLYLKTHLDDEDWAEVAEYPIEVVLAPMIDLSKPPVPEVTHG